MNEIGISRRRFLALSSTVGAAALITALATPWFRRQPLKAPWKWQT